MNFRPRPYNSSRVDLIIELVERIGSQVDFTARVGGEVRRLTVTAKQKDFRKVIEAWCKELPPDTPVYNGRPV
jgi:hypothetical protein